MSLKKNKYLINFIIILFWGSCTCTNRDTDFKGTILSQNELFSFGGWRYSTGNIFVYDTSGMEVSSNELNVSEEERNFVFLLKDDKNVFFKSNKEDSNYVYENGKWEFNATDSSIGIRFSDKRNIKSIQGKLISVTNSELTIQQTTSNNDAEEKGIKKVVTTWYTHNF